VWGGGGCGGPSGGGFDCSGLTQYALCKSGHGEIPRTAQTQYQSGLGRHLPRAEAAAGYVFFLFLFSLFSLGLWGTLSCWGGGGLEMVC